MTPENVISLGKEALIIALLLSAPTLGMGLIVGIIVSIFQAVTSIQEMTLTFIPKLLVGAIALIIFGPWMLMLLLNFTTKILSHLHLFAR